MIAHWDISGCWTTLNVHYYFFSTQVFYNINFMDENMCEGKRKTDEWTYFDEFRIEF